MLPHYDNWNNRSTMMEAFIHAATQPRIETV